MTALLFTIGRFLIGLYIGKSGVASTFGAAGSLIVVFVWVYYSAQIFLLGAEFTWVYAKTFGSRRHALAGEPAKTPSLLPDAESRVGKLPESPLPARASPAPAPAAAALNPRPSLLVQAGSAITAAVLVRYVLPRLLQRRTPRPGEQP